MKENLNRAVSGELGECMDLEVTHHTHTGSPRIIAKPLEPSRKNPNRISTADSPTRPAGGFRIVKAG